MQELYTFEKIDFPESEETAKPFDDSDVSSKSNDS